MPDEYSKTNCELQHKLEEEKRHSLEKYVESIDHRVTVIETDKKEKVKSNWAFAISAFLLVVSIASNLLFTKGCL